MRRLKYFLMPLAFFFMFTNTTQASSVHTVTDGDSLWSIGVDYGVSMQEIQELNGKPDTNLAIGERLQLPDSISDEELDLLARLIHSEAQGEPYAGKVAVGTVVLNRVADDRYPDTITDVIYEVVNGYYAFSPVLDGTIEEPAADESKLAAREALAFEGQGEGSIFFYNPDTATNHWNATRDETKRIGQHVFAK
ncbi:MULTISPECIES: cell wall hydrolase [Geomicrobium]|uniref:N-acetylmuramoyl-L-alanine amidase n=1 Tax=Geomicrobium sediminis TaxID=1347788 RepID=A0ABS2PG97_9BACL|nr:MULTISPECIES: cell wall hydrolase [Geomicrobium]MBM7634459.1 N-acetylmuramoyl-L-alanine amidase [Geomicrobium sediminis]GAJ99540.1 spore cortex-lytic enzyme [Geomicrobium sp. JCM 19055]GAK09781.1 spore cortex-lytic enzyme [Geomicrobium sp. JCM 19038]